MHIATSTTKRIFELCKLFPMPPKALIVCFPKSASTYMMRALCHIGNMQPAEMILSHDRNEQDFFLPRIADHYFKRVAYRAHARATESNIKFLHTLGVEPVVLVRNIFDVVCSFRDHSVKQSLKHSMVYLPESFLEMDKPEQYDMLIDLAIPWYFYFYVSWYEATQNKVVNPLWVQFDDLISNKKDVLSRVCSFYSIPHTPEKIDSVIEELESARHKKVINKNKGIAGRGDSELSDEQKARIAKFASYYPGVDFSPIGL